MRTMLEELVVVAVRLAEPVGAARGDGVERCAGPDVLEVRVEMDLTFRDRCIYNWFGDGGAGWSWVKRRTQAVWT